MHSSPSHNRWEKVVPKYNVFRQARATRNGGRPRILLAVTSDISLRLMRGFPEYLTREGWDVHVVCSPGPVLDETDQNSEVHYHALKMSRNPDPVQDLRALVEWIRLCRDIKPDILSTGTPKAGLLGGIAGFVTAVPRRVYHQRGLRLETSVGIQRLMLGVFERIAIGVAHKVLAVSPSLKAIMITLRLTNEKKIVVIGHGSSNGVDTREFDPKRFSSDRVEVMRASLGLVKGTMTIGYVGRLTTDKGFNVLEAAMYSIQAAEISFNLLIVGGVDDFASRATLQRLHASGLSIASTGAVFDPAIYYQLMDVLCLPTYREGYPNVVLEAAASGLATITTDATGAIDSVLPGVTGRIVPKGDSTALAKELAAALSKPIELKAMGVSARSRVEKHYSRPMVWQQLNQFYRSEMNSRNK